MDFVNKLGVAVARVNLFETVIQVCGGQPVGLVELLFMVVELNFVTSTLAVLVLATLVTFYIDLLYSKHHETHSNSDQFASI